jgi:hypothetical protein
MGTLNQNGMGNIMSPRVPVGANLVKDSALTENELNDLREKFKRQYAISKGWDPNSLTADQINEICLDKRWQQPGMILS